MANRFIEFIVESLFPCHVVPVHVQDVELRHQGERRVEGADHPLRLGFEVGALGYNSIDSLNFGSKTGCQTGSPSGPNSVLGHRKFRHVSKFQK